MRAQLVLAACLFVCCAAVTAEETRRDGTWWNQQSAGFRVLYVLGFMDGMDLGNRFSTPETPDVQNKPEPALDPGRTFRERITRYFAHVTVGQISDGLDAFYRDHRNRSIQLSDGFEIVLRSINGEDVEKLIEARRSSAAGK